MACKGEKISACRVLVGKHVGRRHVGCVLKICGSSKRSINGWFQISVIGRKECYSISPRK